MFEVQQGNQRNQSRASFVDGRGRSRRWRWSVIPVSSQNRLWNMLSRYRYRVMNATEGGLDVCIGDLAIRPLVAAARYRYL